MDFTLGLSPGAYVFPILELHHEGFITDLILAEALALGAALPIVFLVWRRLPGLRSI
jgi:hypothetical protein